MPTRANIANLPADNLEAGASTCLKVALIDSSGNQVSSFGGGSGGTSATDDASFTPGSAGSFTPVGGTYRSTVDPVDDGDAGVFHMTQNRALHVSLRAADGSEASISGGTQYTQDAALTVATTVGVMAAGRASAAAPTGVSADNDAVIPWYLRSGAQATVLTAAGALIGGDATNGLQVDVTRVTGSVAVTNAGTFAVQPAGSVAHDGVATAVNPLLAGGYASAAAPTDVTADGDSVRAWHLRNGAQASVLTAAGALIGGDASNGLDVDVTRVSGTVTVANGGTFAVQSAGGVAHDGAASAVNPMLAGGYASAAAPTDVSADTDAVRAWHLRNGAQATVLTAAGALIGGDATNGLDVDVTRVGGTVTTTAVGTIADDATTPGAPVMIGGMAKSPDGTTPGAVSAEDDVARLTTDLNRRLYVNTEHARSLSTHLDGSSAYTDQSIAAAPGSGLQIVITNIIVSTGAATAMNFFLEEGATKVFGPIYLEAVAGRGFCSGPIWKPITANTAVTITTSAAIAQSVDITYVIQNV